VSRDLSDDASTAGTVGAMDLPVMPPVKPMLAKAAYELPSDPELVFEPKWDGFRCIVFRDGDEVELGSRNDRPLTRYFPEIIPHLKAALPEGCVVDGELVVVTGDRLDFGALQQRIHPAESRVNMLAEATPSSFIAFDLLALDDEDLMGVPFADRRTRLQQALEKAEPPVHLTPTTTDQEVAARWFAGFEGAGLDGVMAKDPAGVYAPDKRVQIKVKHIRLADVVVAGCRMHKDGKGIGSLMIGLYDDEGNLNHVGVASSFSAKRRTELLDEVAELRIDSFEGHPWAEWLEAEAHAREEGGRLPGAPNRWNAQKDMSWIPLDASRVIEVRYEHMEGDRFRNVTRMQRWRPDRTPESCTYDQLEVVAPLDVQTVIDGKA
jgi:ATP-dependent DNA ligase